MGDGRVAAGLLISIFLAREAMYALGRACIRVGGFSGRMADVRYALVASAHTLFVVGNQGGFA